MKRKATKTKRSKPVAMSVADASGTIATIHIDRTAALLALELPKGTRVLLLTPDSTFALMDALHRCLLELKK